MGYKANVSLTQFNNGLVSPEVEARTDLQVSPYSCRQLTNAFPRVAGGVFNRGGSVFVSTTNEQREAILIPFKLTRTISYMLEFTDYQMRVYKNHELVVIDDSKEQDADKYVVLTPYSIEQIKDISYQQIGDVVYLAHKDVKLQKLIRYADNDWRFETVVLSNGPFKKQNKEELKVMSVSATTGNVTLTAQGGGYVDMPEWRPFWDGYSGDVDGTEVRVYDKDGKEIASYGRGGKHNENNYSIYLYNAIKNADCGLKVEQTSPNYKSLRITDTSNGLIYSNTTLKITAYRHRTGGHDDGWRETTITLGTTTEWDAFTENDIGRVIRINKPSDEINYWYVGKTDIRVGNVIKSDGKFYEAIDAGTCGAVKPTHTSGTESDGNIRWKYLHSGYGWGTITSYTNSYTVGLYVNSTMPSLSGGSYKWEMGLLGEEGIYPSVVSYYKDRLVLGVNGVDGPVICFSTTGDYENFGDNEYGTVQSDSAFNLNIMTELSNINFLIAQDNVYVGTIGSVLEIKPSTTSNVFGPKNVDYDIVSSTVGGMLQHPIAIGGSTLFLGATGQDIYDLGYNQDRDTYEPEELSVLSDKHLEQGIIAWSLQYAPNRIIWCTRKDGKLIGFTYNKAQAVKAFHLHETQGEFIDVASKPSADGTTDELWAVVKRDINGVEQYCIEYFTEGIPTELPSKMDSDSKLAYILSNSYFVDCGKQFKFDTPTTIISGLDWLEGKEVSILADGIVIKNKVVENGQIELDNPASVVNVGLPYTTIFEPLPVNLENTNAQSQRINKVILRILTSGGFYYGDEKVEDYASLRKSDEEGEATSLKTGDLKLNWNGTSTHQDIYNNEIPNITGARMVFKQKDPLPLRILSIYPQIEVSND